MITVTEAAGRLSVSPHEVRRLVSTGDLAAERVGRFILVDEGSVYSRVRADVGRGRPLAARTAWASIWEASGERASWLDRSSRSRLRSWLRRTGPEQIAVACRRRARRHDVRVLPTYRGAIESSAGVLLGGMSAAVDVDADVVTAGPVPTEIYCSASTWDGLRLEYGLDAAGPANLVVRVPAFDPPRILAGDRMPVAAVAIDLLESGDPRTRSAGSSILDMALAANIG